MVFKGDLLCLGEQGDQSIVASMNDRRTKDATTTDTAAHRTRDHACAPDKLLFDIQTLHALQERLLCCEGKVWLTQRQLVEEKEKEEHLRSQILSLEDEIERIQTEGLATATRYVEQADTLQRAQDKINQLVEQNEALESRLSAQITEGHAFQKLAEQLIRQLGEKTDGLLEEGIRVTRVLATPWNKEELLAELERKNSLHLKLSQIALLYCRNGGPNFDSLVKRQTSTSSAAAQNPPRSRLVLLSEDRELLTNNASISNTEPRLPSSLFAADPPVMYAPLAGSETIYSGFPFSDENSVGNRSVPGATGQEPEERKAARTKHTSEKVESVEVSASVCTSASANAESCSARSTPLTDAVVSRSGLPTDSTTVCQSAAGPELVQNEGNVAALLHLSSSGSLHRLLPPSDKAVAGISCALLCNVQKGSTETPNFHFPLFERRIRKESEFSGASSSPKEQGETRETTERDAQKDSSHRVVTASSSKKEEKRVFSRSAVGESDGESSGSTECGKEEQHSCCTPAEAEQREDSSMNWIATGKETALRDLPSIYFEDGRGETICGKEKRFNAREETSASAFRVIDEAEKTLETKARKDGFTYAPLKSEGSTVAISVAPASRLVTGSEGNFTDGPSRKSMEIAFSHPPPSLSLHLKHSPPCTVKNNTAQQICSRCPAGEAAAVAGNKTPRTSPSRMPFIRTAAATGESSLSPQGRAPAEKEEADQYSKRIAPAAAPRGGISCIFTAVAVDQFLKMTPTAASQREATLCLSAALVAADAAPVSEAPQPPQKKDLPGLSGDRQQQLTASCECGREQPPLQASNSLTAAAGKDKENTQRKFGAGGKPSDTAAVFESTLSDDVSVRRGREGPATLGDKKATAKSGSPSSFFAARPAVWAEAQVVTEPAEATLTPSKGNYSTGCCTGKEKDDVLQVKLFGEEKGLETKSKGGSSSSSSIGSSPPGATVPVQATPREKTHPQTASERDLSLSAGADGEQYISSISCASSSEVQSGGNRSKAAMTRREIEKPFFGAERQSVAAASAKAKDLPRGMGNPADCIRVETPSSTLEHDLHLRVSGHGFPTAEQRLFPEKDEELETTRRRPGVSRLPPLPPHHQSALFSHGRSSIVLTKYNCKSSFPTKSQALRRLPIKSTSKVESSSAAAAEELAKMQSRSNTSGSSGSCSSSSSPALAKRNVNVTGENRTAKMSLRRFNASKRSGASDLQQAQRTENRLRSSRKASFGPRPYPSSNANAGELARSNAVEHCIGDEDTKSRQPQLERNKWHSHSATKIAANVQSASAGLLVLQEEEDRESKSTLPRGVLAKARPQEAASRRLDQLSEGEGLEFNVSTRPGEAGKVAGNRSTAPRSRHVQKTEYYDEDYSKKTDEETFARTPSISRPTITTDTLSSITTTTLANSKIHTSRHVSHRRPSSHQVRVRTSRTAKLKDFAESNSAVAKAALGRISCWGRRASNELEAKTSAFSQSTPSSSRHETKGSVSGNKWLYDESVAFSSSRGVSAKAKTNSHPRGIARSSTSSGSNPRRDSYQQDTLVYHAQPATNREARSLVAVPEASIDLCSRRGTQAKGGSTCIANNKPCVPAGDCVYLKAFCTRASSAEHQFVDSTKSNCPPNSNVLLYQKQHNAALGYHPTSQEQLSAAAYAEKQISSAGAARTAATLDGGDVLLDTAEPLLSLTDGSAFFPANASGDNSDIHQCAQPTVGESRQRIAANQQYKEPRSAAAPSLTAVSTVCLRASSKVCRPCSQGKNVVMKNFLHSGCGPVREHQHDEAKHQTSQRDKLTYAMPLPLSASVSLAFSTTRSAARGGAVEVSPPLSSGMRVSPAHHLRKVDTHGTVVEKQGVKNAASRNAARCREAIAEEAEKPLMPQDAPGGPVPWMAAAQSLTNAPREDVLAVHHHLPNAASTATSTNTTALPVLKSAVAAASPKSPLAGEQEKRYVTGMPHARLSAHAERKALVKDRSPAFAARCEGIEEEEQSMQQQMLEAGTRHRFQPAAAAASAAVSRFSTHAEKTPAGGPFQQQRRAVEAGASSTAATASVPAQAVQAAAAFTPPAAFKPAAAATDCPPRPARQQDSPEAEEWMNARTNLSAPLTVVQRPTPSLCLAATGSTYNTFRESKQAATTALYPLPTPCRVFGDAESTIVEGTTFGGSSVAFPVCNRSSVPLQQHCKIRPVLLQGFESQVFAAAAAGHPQQQEQKVRSQQNQLGYIVNWGNILDPRPWQAPRPRQRTPQCEAPAQLLLQHKGPHARAEVVLQEPGELRQQQLQQQRCLQQLQKPLQQQQEQQPERRVVPQGEVRHEHSQEKEILSQRQHGLKPPEKSARNTTQLGFTMPPQLARQTLPRGVGGGGGKFAVRSSLLCKQQRSQERNNTSQEKPRQRHAATLGHRGEFIAAATDQQWTPDLPSADMLQQEQQQHLEKKIAPWDVWVNSQQQYCNTTGASNTCGFQNRSQEHHSSEEFLLKNQQSTLQVKPRLKFDAVQQQPGEQQSQANWKQQVQLTPGAPQMQPCAAGRSIRSANVHSIPKPSLQFAQSQQHVAHDDRTQPSQQRALRLEQGLRQQQQQQQHRSLHASQHEHARNFPYPLPYGFRVQEQQVQTQAIEPPHQRKAQQAEHLHAIPTRWSCGLPGDFKEIRLEPFEARHQQRFPTMQLTLQQQQTQQRQQQQSFQQQMQLQRIQPQPPQVQQRHVEPLQQQLKSQRMLQQQLWQLAQMPRSGMLPVRTAQENFTGSVYMSSGRSTQANNEARVIKHTASTRTPSDTISAAPYSSTPTVHAQMQLPSNAGRMPSSGIVTPVASDGNFLLPNSPSSAAVSPPAGFPPMQTSRLTAPVFTAASAAYREGCALRC